MDLTQWGYNETFMAAFAALNKPALRPARVTAEHKSAYRVATERGELPAAVSGRYRYDDMTPPTVGDFVAVGLDETGQRAVIHALLPRRTAFSRSDGWTAEGMQTLGANFDTVFVCMSLNRNFNLARMERYLILAADSGAGAAVVLTKADLCPDAPIRAALAEAVAGGVPVYAVNALDARDAAPLLPYFAPGRTVIALGSSGVGKSTLVNTLFGQTLMRTGQARDDDDRGRHTTAHRQLIPLPGGGLYLDTPGLREVGLVGGEEEVSRRYAPVEELAGSCRFADCTHSGEPGCAVRGALDAGELDPRQWQQYQKLSREARYQAFKEQRRQRQQGKKHKRGGAKEED